MSKFLKLVKSRYMFSAFAIILVFVQLMVVFGLLYRYSHVMVVLGYVFYIGVFLYIINKYKSPEFKLPWTIIMLLFFVMGAFAFLLLTSNEQNKKLLEKFRANKERDKVYLGQEPFLEKLKEEDGKAYLQANYIRSVTGLPAYKNTEVTYYKIGEEFNVGLLDALRKAKRFIFMEYFIIEEGVMWDAIYEVLKEKVRCGVKVFLIYDDFGSMMTLDSKYYEKVNADGICCIPSNKFRPIFSNIHNNRDHRKITVIDGLVGFTGGINLADEYINAKVKHGHWKDTGVKLEGEAVKSLTALFLEMWNSQSEAVLESSEYLSVSYKKKNADGVVVPYGDAPEDFYKDDIGKNVYLNMLNAAEEYVYITTPYLICDYEILNTICLCAKKGVDVRIIVPHVPDKKLVFWMTQSNYEVLVKSGVKIYEYTPGFIHAKQFICDGVYATCGTINLDYRSLVHHFECGVWMYNVECIKDMKRDFFDTLEVSEEVTEELAKLKGWKKLVTEVMKVFFPLF